MAKRPRGTRDFGPDEMAARRGLEARLRGVFGRFGYQEVQTPTFEELELFTAKSGEGIIDELYAFEDKGGRRLALRPELTAPVMRMYFQEHAFEPKPIKWFYFGNCFRYDRPQAGRYREFWQFGCEQIGAGTPLAYAELVALAEALLDEAGLEARETRIGHVAILRELVDALRVPAAARGAVMRAIDKRDEGLRGLLEGHGARPDAVLRLIDAMEARDLDAARAAAGDHPGFAELEATFGYLDDLGVTGARLDLGIARGLDYYTSIVLETHCPLLGAEKQLLGGGGYDLAGVFGGQATPTMGFGLGFDRLLAALEKEGRPLPPAAGPTLYLAALGNRAARTTAQAAAQLRRAGVHVEMDLMGRKPAAVAKHAEAVGAGWLCIIGDRELEAGAVQVKKLATRSSVEVPLDELPAWRPPGP